MSRKLRVAAVGTGYFSQFHYDAWSRCADVELVGVADLNQSQAEAVTAQYGGRAYGEAARRLRLAVDNAFRDGSLVSTERGGQAGVVEITAAVMGELQALA